MSCLCIVAVHQRLFHTTDELISSSFTWRTWEEKALEDLKGELQNDFLLLFFFFVSCLSAVIPHQLPLNLNVNDTRANFAPMQQFERVWKWKDKIMGVGGWSTFRGPNTVRMDTCPHNRSLFLEICPAEYQNVCLSKQWMDMWALGMWRAQGVTPCFY